MDFENLLSGLRERVQARFDAAGQAMTFEEFLEQFAAHPYRHLRTSPQYLVEMFDHFGTREASRVGQEATRFRLFDLEPSGPGSSLIGQERVQQEVYAYLVSFAKRGKADKMLLLHGPNGSGKTTVIESVVRGLEEFSRTAEGVLLSFSWVFTDRDGKLERIGFDSVGQDEEALSSYAHLESGDVAARFPCELRCSPLFLFPREERVDTVAGFLGAVSTPPYPKSSYDRFLQGDLCQKCRRIYDSLLVAYRGDWSRVLRHVRVERFWISKRYRCGAVSIEPQGNVDGGVQPITSEHSWNIPLPLRNVTLYQVLGDIVDANRGVLEYSDFLKRPLEMNKYLLTTCERGTASFASNMVYLDLTIFGTANEKQLNLFKRSPDFSSFKGRMELIPVPYLLRYSVEAELYRRQIRSVVRERPVSPHTAKVAALWAVLTRLRRPRAESYSEPLGKIVASLEPIEKAKLYDSGEVPDRLGEDEKKRLRAAILDVRAEFAEHEDEFEGIFGAEYEGRRGVSPREVLSLLARAAENRTYRSLSPMAVFDAIEELIRDASVYDFLRIPADGGYHDVRGLLDAVREEYLRWVTGEVYDSIDLIDEKEYERIFLEYFRHVKAFDAKEKVFNASTNSYEPPSEDLMRRIEALVEVQQGASDYRSNVMTRIAAWALDHPQRQIDYPALFPEISKALRENFYRERKRLITLIEQDILKFGTDEFELLSSVDQKRVVGALRNMREKYGYTEDGARDVIAYVLKCSMSAS